MTCLLGEKPRPEPTLTYIKYGIHDEHLIKSFTKYNHYRQVSNKRRTLVGNQIVDHSDAVGASPVGAAPTTSSFST